MARVEQIRAGVAGVSAEEPSPAAPGPVFSLPQATATTAVPQPAPTATLAGGTGLHTHEVGAAPGLAPAPAAGGYVHPLGGAGELIGTPNAGTHTLGNWQSDNALDFRTPEGTPVYAVADGVVGPQVGPLGSSESRFAGERLTLESAGNAFYYAHLSQVAVAPGQPVVQGQLLGYSGSANGVPHLHFGQREGDPQASFAAS